MKINENDSNLKGMSRKGFYIKKEKNNNSLILNLYINDFIKFITENADDNGWINLRIYEHNKLNDKGFTHNMELITMNKSKKTTHE